jgi:imidazolonepropionase-like amidohydrolase
MRHPILVCLLSTSLLSAGQAGAQEPPLRSPAEERPLLLRDVTVVTLASAGTLEGWQVLIHSGRVAGMEPTVPDDWPTAVQVVDGAGKFLLPALYDLHVHIFDERDLELYALMGIATVRNMDGWGWHLDLERDRQRTRAFQARMLTTGPQYQPPLVDSPESVARQVAWDKELGFDWIKAYDGLDRPMLEALSEAAQQQKMRVTGHLPDALPVTEALATGAFSDVAHLEELLPGLAEAAAAGNDALERRLDLLADALAVHHTAVVTTLVNNLRILDQISDRAASLARPEVGLAAPMLQLFWGSPWNPYAAQAGATAPEHLQRSQLLLQRLAAGLDRRGVLLLAGTDAPNPTTVPAYSLYKEIELLAEAGLGPERALRSATSRAADYLGEPLSGRVQLGARADLLLLDGNPLDEITALRRRSGVVIGGVYRGRRELEARIDELRQTYAGELSLLQRFDPESPLAILEVLDSEPEARPLSAAALTSLVWVYLKFRNLDAARAVAERLRRTYPGERSDRVSQLVALWEP